MYICKELANHAHRAEHAQSFAVLQVPIFYAIMIADNILSIFICFADNIAYVIRGGKL